MFDLHKHLLSITKLNIFPLKIKHVGHFSLYLLLTSFAFCKQQNYWKDDKVTSLGSKKVKVFLAAPMFTNSLFDARIETLMFTDTVESLTTYKKLPMTVINLSYDDVLALTDANHLHDREKEGIGQLKAAYPSIEYVIVPVVIGDDTMLSHLGDFLSIELGCVVWDVTNKEPQPILIQRFKREVYVRDTLFMTNNPVVLMPERLEYVVSSLVEEMVDQIALYIGICRG